MAVRNKDNITKFRRDKRLAVVGGLRSLALLMLLATVVFCIFEYREEFNLNNLSRIGAYLGSASRVGEFRSYKFESGLDTVYVPFEAGLAVFSGNTYRYITALPEGDFTAQMRASNPAVSAGEKKVLLYDRGGRNLSVVNSYATLWSDMLESPIISAEMNEKGAFCVVTDEVGYRSAVALYDTRQRQAYKWYTSDYFVMLASPGPDGQSFAALCLREKDGAVAFTLRGYSVEREEPEFSIELPVQAVYSLKHSAGGNLVLICDNGVYIYDDKGQMLGQSGFAHGTLQRFAHHQGQPPCLALQSGGAGERVMLRIVGEDGAAVFEKAYSGSLRALDGLDGCAALLFQSRLVMLEGIGEEPKETVLQMTGARDVVTRRGGKHILVYSDRAELVTVEEEDK